MKLAATIVGSLGRIMAEEVKAGEKAATAAVRQVGDGLKAAWRAQIVGAGLGMRLAKTIQSQAYPRSGQSLNAAVVVWSKAPVIVGAHDTGPLIRSRNGLS
jgi:dUTPase